MEKQMGGYCRLVIIYQFLLSLLKTETKNKTLLSEWQGEGAYRLRMTPVYCLVKTT